MTFREQCAIEAMKLVHADKSDRNDLDDERRSAAACWYLADAMEVERRRRECKVCSEDDVWECPHAGPAMEAERLKREQPESMHPCQSVNPCQSVIEVGGESFHCALLRGHDGAHRVGQPT